MKDESIAEFRRAIGRLDHVFRELDKEMVKTKHYFEFKRAVTDISYRLNDIDNLIYVAEQEEKK